MCAQFVQFGDVTLRISDVDYVERINKLVIKLHLNKLIVLASMFGGPPDPRNPGQDYLRRQFGTVKQADAEFKRLNEILTGNYIQDESSEEEEEKDENENDQENEY